MSLQTIHPPKDVVSPIVTSYGEHSISVRPETIRGESPLVVKTPGEPTWVLQGSEGQAIPTQGGYFQPFDEATTVQHTSYGVQREAWYEDLGEGMPWALSLGLVILGVWIAIKVISLFFKGVHAVLSFLWAVVTFPFRLTYRLVRGAGRLVFGMPKHVSRVASGGAAAMAAGGKAVGRTVSRSYESMADAYNRSSVEPGPALRRAKASMLRAQRKVEAAGRKLGQKLESTGLVSIKISRNRPLVSPTPPRSSHRAAEYAGQRNAGFQTHSAAEIQPDFPGYKILSELPRGGSGARLYLARPRRETVARLADRGVEAPSQVVVKWFSLQGGAHMSGILREGRALDAAKQLGQVLEHVSDQDGLYYVMPYVAGDTLDQYIAKLHGWDGAQERAVLEPLKDKELQEVLSLAHDLMTELERFHQHGLWHKDIKPGNLIVHKGRMNVVDLGLLTPLASALTLTTHGTEYYRDPEMVRLAMRGAQVRDVDAAKFDLYSAGAVLFSMLEGTFPAHGNLSRLTRPCPPALGWVVRRAMAEHDSRYASASAMRSDLAYLREARDLAAVKPKDLPSWNQGVSQSSDPAAAESPSPSAGPAPMGHEVPPAEADDAMTESWDSEEALADAMSAQEPSKSWVRRTFTRARVAALIAIAVGAAVVLEGERSSHGVVSYARPNVTSSLPSAPEIPFLRWDAYERAHWARGQVDALFEDVPERAIQTVYLHGLPKGRAGGLMEALISSTMVSEKAKGLAVDPLDPEARRFLPLAASVSHLLDPLPAGELPSTAAQIEFFLENPEVQAIMDFGGGADPAKSRFVISPLLGTHHEARPGAHQGARYSGSDE